MNRKLYTWLIFFLGLSAASAFLQGIIYVLVGQQIFMLDSFDSWFLVINITAFIGSMLLVRYYYFRQFGFVFVAAIIYYISAIVYAFVFYVILHFQKLGSYNLAFLIIFVLTGIVYAISLIILRAAHVRWLKVAGVLMVIIGLSCFSTLVWRTSLSNRAIVNISQWTTFATCLIPLCFILHFKSEIGRRSRDNWDAPAPGRLQDLVGLAGVAGLIVVLSFGLALSFESYSTIYWGNANYKKTLELARLYDAEIFVDQKGDTLRYRLLKPMNYNPAKKYPIVISLPYGGQPGTDTIRQIEGAVAAELLSTESNRRAYPAFIFIPNCPPGGGWGGIPNYPEADSLVFDAIIALDSQYSIDGRRRYVTGLSRGGYGTWNFICKRPDLFAAAVPVSGGGDARLAPNAAHVPVWAFHGAEDRNVPVSGSRNMIDAIKRAGGHPRYTEFPDAGHNIWHEVSITPGLLDWLFAQHRE